MSSSSGITLTQDLLKKIQTLRNDEDVIYIFLQINEESLSITEIGKETKETYNTLSEKQYYKDIFTKVHDTIIKDTPAYILIRSYNTNRFHFIYYAPEDAKIKNKMLYASSLNSLKQSLGGNIIDCMIVRELNECSYDSYQEYKKALNADRSDVLTIEEKAINEALRSSYMMASNKQAKCSIDLPIKIDPYVVNALNDIDNTIKSVRCHLDIDTETLYVSEIYKNYHNGLYTDCDKKPFFLFFMYPYENIYNLVLIYFCPEDAPLRLKMFYSSCKSFIYNYLKSIDRYPKIRLECSTPDDITDEYIQESQIPRDNKPKVLAKPKMFRPSSQDINVLTSRKVQEFSQFYEDKTKDNETAEPQSAYKVYYLYQIHDYKEVIEREQEYSDIHFKESICDIPLASNPKSNGIFDT